MISFAAKWQKAWNSHDIEQIMAHYADNITLRSPIAKKLMGNPVINGFVAVKDYFIQGLKTYPDLKFKVIDVLCGEQSIIIYYVNQKGIKVAEFMQFDQDGKVFNMHAHYSNNC